jgi:hypothetical protein
LAETDKKVIDDLKKKGLHAEVISAELFYKGIAPYNFETIAGAPYKPSYNEEPEIPAQCWIETSYGTQNACKYCHTDYLASIKHGNSFPIAEDQILYSFPSPNLNRILWQNIIYPQNIEDRLNAEGIKIPDIDDVYYVRYDNWLPTFEKARGDGNANWLNNNKPNDNYALFPALNPNHLFPFNPSDPTNGNTNGYIDSEGFVRSETEEYTGWRAINFFPYAIFTPLTGSVSGIYIRLPHIFMSQNHEFDVEIYKQNLDLLEQNIKNQSVNSTRYVGDANHIDINEGFYPVGTEFAHPLHYVDLNADGEYGNGIDGIITAGNLSYEFPGTRSKRVKEIRYMYKWREVDLDDISLEDEDEDEDEDENKDEEENEFQTYIGREGQGWVDNGAGWILAAFIENRHGELRPQTTEELAQCLGCHSKVGNTIDAVWSFQRKLPDLEGWAEMNYGNYNSKEPQNTKLQDYLNISSNMGELGYFYYSVVGADLYGIMPPEIRDELISFSKSINLSRELGISYGIDEILDDEILKKMDKTERKPRLLARQKLMRHYSSNKKYLAYNKADDKFYVKGNIFYPTPETMKANIQGYRKIVLDQSFNLGKDVFGSKADHIPFTFRSDGTVRDEKGNIIPTGNVIYSRPYNEDGVGITPTGIVLINDKGDVLDREGNIIDPLEEPEKAVGHFSTGGTFDIFYNPILSGIPIKK